MWNKKIVFILIYILSFYSAIAEPTSTEESIPFQLSWQEVPGSSGYLIEIKNSSGYMVISEKINVNLYPIVGYTSGIYQHRIGVINKLGKVGSFSEWVSFEVVVSKVPTLTSNNVYSVSREEKTKTILLTGSDFMDPMKVYLVLDGKKIPAKKVTIESSGKATAIFEIDPNINTGIYDLVIENPRKKILNAKQRVVLSDSKEKAEKFANRQERILKKEITEDYYETPYWSTFWRSSLLPGWGQSYIDGQNWKVYTYPILALGIAGAYANAFAKYKSEKANYDNAVLLGFLFSENTNTQIFWLINRNNAADNFDSAKHQLSNIQAGAGIFGVFILYNLIDSYFSARRNVAYQELQPGFPIGQENIRMKLNTSRDTSLSTPMKAFGPISTNYQLEFQLSF